MAEHTKIEWSQATWNVVTGCTRVSEGCDHCYIERTPPFRMAGRRFDKPGVGGSTGVVLHPDRLTLPLRWRKPRRIFVNSLSDLFHDDIPDEYIAEVWHVMRRCPQHVFQILTKRPARMRSLLTRWAPVTGIPPGGFWTGPWPLTNVWGGVSVENQDLAERRIPILIDTPLAVRWISAEPLLGPIRLPFIAEVDACTCYGGSLPGIGHEPGCGTEPGPAWGNLHWVVAGGESGPGARPMHPDWVRSLRDQCVDAGVPFFFKQAGSALAREWGCTDPKGGNPAEWPDYFPREYPDAAA